MCLEAVKKVESVKTALSTIALLQLTSYLYPLPANVTNGASYDYIVVGAGSAGSVIANRLTEDPNVNVLLIEAGGDPPIESNLPGLASYNLKSRLDWNHKSQVDKETFQCLQKYQMHIGHGKVLGGTSSINFMHYVRGDPNDFNKWAHITGDQSWNYTNVLHYFKKSERLVDLCIRNSITSKFHGYEGNIGVTQLNDDKTKQYLQALKETGYNTNNDINSDDTLGFSELMITLVDGIRQSTANAFLSVIKDRSNLHVMKESLATKIVIDENKIARGVQVLDKNNKTLTINASKEVIISAGAINSPQLLMLSGIGPKNVLQKLQIKVIANLPVGKNLQTHVAVFLATKMSKVNRDTQPFNPHEYPSSVVTGFVALNGSQKYPDYQLVINNADADSIAEFCFDTLSFNDYYCKYLYEQLTQKDAVNFLLYNSDSKPRGRITLESTNPKDSPLIHMYPFRDETDLENYINYIEDFSRIVESSYFRNLNAEFVTLPKCKGFGVGSRDYWKCYIKCLHTSSYHYAGSCPMGSVVDSRLRVYGVKRLRVADASVMPAITSGNTNAPTIMIGEKAADMIKEDNCGNEKPNRI